MSDNYPTGFSPFDIILFNTIKHKDNHLIITAVCASSPLAYVGTYDGKLILYEYRIINSLYECKRRKTIQLGTPGNPIDKIIIVNEFASILILCGGQLHILNMFSLDISAIIPKEVGTTEATMRAIGQLMGVKGDNRILSFCIQNPVESFRICCQIRGALMFYEILGSKGEQPHPFLTIPLQENQQGQQMLWTNRCCFIGTSQEYLVFHLNTSASETLFTLDNNPAQILYTHEDVLLISGRVGVFVDFNGKITRGSVTWSTPPLSISYSKPYIVALLHGGKIEVHNIYNQLLVQQLSYSQRFRHISNGDLLLMATRDQIYCLTLKPMIKQLEQLIDLNYINEALNLAKTVWNNNPQELREFYTRIGLVWFTQGNFEQSIPVLLGSSIDLREIIILFPDYCPIGDRGSFKREYNYNIQNNVDIIQAKQALLQLLESKRNRSLVPPILIWTDSALLKLYIEFSNDKLDGFLEESEYISFNTAENCLKDKGLKHHLAKLYKKHNKIEEALKCMKSIGIDEIVKTGYDPLDDTIELLIQTDDSKLVLEYGLWVIKQDPKRGIKIFIDPNRKSNLDTSNILEILSEFGKYYQIEYMDYLIFNKGIIDEDLHTTMGIYCIDILKESNKAPNVSRKKRGRGRIQPIGLTNQINTIDPQQLQIVEQKLLKLLQYSEYYNSATLLGRIQGDGMLYDACVILYSRLGKHKEALDILVNKKQDFNGADSYCVKHSEAADTNLFQELLHYYMDTSQLSNASEIPDNAFNLMNNRGSKLNPLQVLDFLPDDIPIEKIEKFLRSSSQNIISEMRMKMIEANLCKMERILVTAKLQKVHSNRIIIDNSILCSVCKKTIGESVFSAYPNGILVHYKCMEDENICPITKRNFIKKPVNIN